MALSPELHEYYENYLTLFASSGWEQLKEEVIQHISSLEKTTLRQGNTDTFLHNQGAVAALEYIIHYDEVVKSTYDELLNEDDVNAAV
jgi:hypothetical protein